jgi:hypothetical protein
MRLTPVFLSAGFVPWSQRLLFPWRTDLIATMRTTDRVEGPDGKTTALSSCLSGLMDLDNPPNFRPIPESVLPYPIHWLTPCRTRYEFTVGIQPRSAFGAVSEGRLVDPQDLANEIAQLDGVEKTDWLLA